MRRVQHLSCVLGPVRARQCTPVLTNHPAQLGEGGARVRFLDAAVLVRREEQVSIAGALWASSPNLGFPAGNVIDRGNRRRGGVLRREPMSE